MDPWAHPDGWMPYKLSLKHFVAPETAVNTVSFFDGGFVETCGTEVANTIFEFCNKPALRFPPASTFLNFFKFQRPSLCFLWHLFCFSLAFLVLRLSCSRPGDRDGRWQSVCYGNGSGEGMAETENLWRWTMLLCVACENNSLKPVNSTNTRVVGQRAHGTLPFMFVH